MKFKKYNTSLSSLYNHDINEGYGRLRNRAMYADPDKMYCKIDVPDNIREFVFMTGNYKKDQDHTKAFGALLGKKNKHGVAMVANIPVRILTALETALGDPQVFNAIMDGPVADLVRLGMTPMECRLINLGLNQLSKVLAMFYNFKSGAKEREQESKREQEEALRQAQLVGAATLPGITQNNQTFFLLSEEEQAKLNNISSLNRIEKFKFQQTFEQFEDPQHLGKIDQTVLHFENFFIEYYTNQNWDVNKLQEDIDIIVRLAKTIKRISSSSTLVNIYKTFLNEIDVNESSHNIKLLESLEAQARMDKSGSDLFEKKFLNMIFSPDINNDSSFYGRIIYILDNNRKLQASFDREIKNKIQLLKREIMSVIS